ncbi:hypothetical protein EYR41_001870 [Orbilia oligospora]|uniref:F-box domain-containing protein n=1 Tax=Orbilia oligospora TaxID=2813651 RepID=A0A8H2HXH2_ORBOL|nr:hypothetical protein EYR41_001870 [Orbilia oligospora]
MPTKSPNSSYFLRSFKKLSTAQSKSDPDAPEYIGRPKSSLDCMPLEILLEIAFYLPDARTAVQLSCVSSSLYWKLAGSQYFWYRFGNQVLKKFQKFSQTYNYHGYIVTVMSGGIKSTCQICLTPKRGIVRKGIGKVVCMICLDQNIVRADVVQQISDMDLTNLQEFEAIFYLDGEPNSRINRLPWHKRSCYWLPAVKRGATKAYGLPWGEVVAMHQDVRPLASPKQIREYYHQVREKIFDETTSRFRQELGRLFRGILEPDTFRGMLRLEQSGITAGLSVPTEGQNDQADDAWPIELRIEAHEPVICLTLSIPIEAFRSLIEREKSEIGSPFFHLAISHVSQSQSFSALRSRFGKLDPAVVLNLDDANIEEGSPVLFEDPEGWQGKSDVIFSCMVPTWIVLLKDFKVSLEFTPQPFLLDTLPAKVFECSVHDYNNARLSTKLPLSILTGLHLSEENGPPGQGVKLVRIGASTPDESKKVRITRKIIFSENENRIERMVSGNPKDQQTPVYVQFPVGVADRENRSVGAWNLHRINLDKSPPILISLHKYGKEGYEWVNKYFKAAFTEQELQHSRGTPTDEASGVNETLVGVKGTIYRMIIGHTGIRQKQSSSYLLQNPTIPQSATMLFPERSSRRSLIYTNRNPPFVPLEESLATAPLPIEIENLSEIQVTEKETSAWMQLSVRLVERCRTWVHKPRIFTKAFYSDPAFKPWAPYATRAAIGPIFPPRPPPKVANRSEIFSSFGGTGEND